MSDAYEQYQRLVVRVDAFGQAIRQRYEYRKFGFDYRVGHFRPPGIVEVVPKSPVLQVLRCFYLGHRLLGWPTP